MLKAWAIHCHSLDEPCWKDDGGPEEEQPYDLPLGFGVELIARVNKDQQK
ncbi:alpha-N-arabinofuranosidase [Alicyclobacillus hesperidum URH17-3-68]|nr:alpha-N-arabinofuranosidase [Alicyclobacillus hesperidum URH17-3-68]